MNIESFVSQTLEQLGAGVVKAHGKPGVTISPRPYMRDDTSNTAGDHWWIAPARASSCLSSSISQ